MGILFNLIDDVILELIRGIVRKKWNCICENNCQVLLGKLPCKTN